jgi:hypothetical protein
MTDAWRACADLAGLWWARHGVVDGVALAAGRLDELVRHARAASPFYARHYRDVPANAPLHELPPVSRRALMARFDDWCTDREVRRPAVERFLADR